MSADLSVRKPVSAEPEQYFGLAWTADSLSIVAASDRDGAFGLWRISVDGARRALLARGIGGYVSPFVSPDGRTLLFSHVVPVRNLYLASAPEGQASAEDQPG